MRHPSITGLPRTVCLFWLACAGCGAGSEQAGPGAPSRSQAGAEAEGNAAGAAGRDATGAGAGSDATRSGSAESKDPAPSAGAGSTAQGGAEEPPFVPGECTITALDPTTLCADPSACPVDVAGEVDCAGEGANPSVAWQGEQLYATLDFDTGADRALLALRVDPEAATHAVHVIEHVERGLVRLDGDAAVLLAVTDAQLVPHRAQPDFETFSAGEARALALPLWDAGYDDAGALHVFGREERGLSQFSVDGTVVAERTADAAAAIAPDGRTALAYSSPNAGQMVLQSWDSTTDSITELAAPMPLGAAARVALTPYSVAPNGWLAAWDVGMGVQTRGTPLDGRPGLGVWSVLPNSACTGLMPASGGGSCPADTSSHALGEQVLRHGLVADTVAGPWLLSLVADTTELCSWGFTGGCFETMPCSCQQQSHPSFGPTTLVLQSIAEQVTTWRLPLSASPRAFAFTPLFDGAFFVVSSAVEPTDEGRRTRLRYLRVRLARAS